MKDNDLDVRWDEYNHSYAKDHEKRNPDVHGEFIEVLKLYTPNINEKILEIGCNTGEFCGLLNMKYNLEPEGVDINIEAIKIAKEKYPHLNFHVKDLFDLEGKYDVIYMQHVIEHIKNPQEAFLKLKNLLNPQGKLIITCPNHWAYPSKLFCWIRKIKFCYDPTHIFEFSPRELSKIINDASFNVKKIKTKPMGIPFIYRISISLQYIIPCYMFGDFIFVLAEKTNDIKNIKDSE